MKTLFRYSLLVIAIFVLAACQPAAVTPAPSTSLPTSAATLPATTAPEPTQPAPTVAPTIAPTTGGPITLTDGLDRSVTLSEPAQKIVSMAPSNTEILFAVGAGKQVIGRDDFSNYPEEAKALPSVGGNMGKYNMEQIAALKPDLVLASGLNTPEQVKSLEDLGITVYYLANPTDLNGMYENLRTVAKLTGHAEETETLIASLQKRVDAVTAAIPANGPTPKVYYELDATDPSKPYTSGPGTFVDQLIKLAGGENIGGSLTDAWAAISSEEVIKQNPDIILLGDSAYGVTAESLAQRSGWSTLTAVKEAKIYPFNDDLVSRPTPRLVDGLEAFAKIIHPEAFK